MTNYIDSYSGLEKTKLGFVQDSNGVYHLKDNIVSRKWLIKNKSATTFSRLLIGHIDKASEYVIDCTAYKLTGTEANNLTLEEIDTL